MNEKLACEKFYQIVNAVDYCHRQNIVHRDLKVSFIIYACVLLSSKYKHNNNNNNNKIEELL